MKRAEDPYLHRPPPPGCQRTVSTQSPLSNHAAEKTSAISAPGAPEITRWLRFRGWTQQSRKAQRIHRGTTMKSEKTVNSAPAHSPEELVAGIRAGDESAWRAMSEQCEPLLRWLARLHGLSAEDAGDAIQLTWLRCLEHIDQLTNADKLNSWLVTICRRECIRLATKARREVPLSAPDMEQLIDTRREEGDPCTEATLRDQYDRLYQ